MSVCFSNLKSKEKKGVKYQSRPESCKSEILGTITHPTLGKGKSSTHKCHWYRIYDMWSFPAGQHSPPMFWFIWNKPSHFKTKPYPHIPKSIQNQNREGKSPVSPRNGTRWVDLIAGHCWPPEAMNSRILDWGEKVQNCKVSSLKTKCWRFRNPANQLRLLVYPVIYNGFTSHVDTQNDALENCPNQSCWGGMVWDVTHIRASMIWKK